MPDPRQAEDHVRSVARSGALSLGGAAGSAVAGLVLVAAITNGLERETAGTVFVTTASFLILLSVVQLGTEVGLVRWLPLLLVRGRAQSIRAVLLAALLPVLALSASAALVVLVLADELARLILPGADTELVVDQIRVLAPLLVVGAVLNVLLAGTRGLRTMLPTVLVESIGRSLLQLAAVVLVLLLDLGPVAVVAAWSAPYLVAAAAVAVWLVRLLGRKVPGWRARQDGDDVRSDVRGFWRFTSPRALGTTSQAVLKRVDIVLVAALQSPAEAALYTAATRFVALGQLGVQALQQALGPHLSGHFALEDSRAARDVYRATAAWAMLLAWPVYLVAASTADLALRLFGDGYEQVAPVVVLLCLAMLVATACGAVDTVLLMSGHSWLSLGNNLVALLLNLGLNVLLIPEYGALGAGIAWSAAIVLRNLLPLVQIRLLHGVSPLGRGSLIAMALSVSCFGLPPLAVLLLPGDVWMRLAALAAGALAFALGTWRCREALGLGDLVRAVTPRRGRGRVTVA